MKVPELQQQIQPEAPVYYRKPATAPDGAFGGQVAMAGMQASNVANEMAVKAKHKEDFDAVQSATNDLTSNMLQMVNGENGLLSAKGDAAKGITQKFEQDLAKIKAQQIEKFTNDDQVRAFESHNSENAFNFARSVSAHERNQMLVAADERHKAGQITNIQQASSFYKDPDLLASAINKIERETSAYATANGITPEMAKVQVNSNTTAAITAAWKTAIDFNDINTAKDILTKYKDKVDPLKYAELMQHTTKTLEKNTNYMEAEEIYAKSLNPDGTFSYEKYAANMKDKYLNPNNTGSNSVLQAGEKQLGKPYGPLRNGGGNGTTTTDCGLFIQTAFRDVGADVGGRTVDDMYQRAEQGQNNMSVVDKKDLKPGDIVFYKNTSYQADEAYKRITHAGIYAGDGKILHAGSSTGVAYADINLGGAEIAGYARVNGIPSGTAGGGVDYEKHQAINNIVMAKAVDAHRIKVEQEKNALDVLIKSADGSDTLADATKIIMESNQPWERKHLLITHQQERFKMLAGNPTAEQLFWNKYEKEGLYQDLKNIQIWQDRLAKRDDIDEKDLAHYQESSTLLNRYWAQSQGKPQPTQQPEQPIATHPQKLKWWDAQVAELKRERPNITDEQINQFLTKKIMGGMGGW